VKTRWDLVALVYVGLAIAGAVLSRWFNGTHPWVHPHPWLLLGPFARDAISCGLGLGFGLLVVLITRITVTRARWAQRLHEQLRPVAQGMRTHTVVIIATLSSFGEEMFFRSFLTPLLGVVAQAVVFGLLHQVRGSSRWVWVGWAAAVGLVLGLLYWSLGSLGGPLVAHAVINGLNLVHLRDHSVAQLGGTKLPAESIDP
jgi:uncharacterized protein